MKVAFFGTEEFSLPSLRALIENHWPIDVVITKPDSPRGRGRKPESPAVKKLAVENNIAVIQPVAKSQIPDKITTHQNLDIGIVVAYGLILPPSVINYFPGGLINVHASLLPAYRGPSPIEAAILAGDSQTGVTLMQIKPKMDAGGIYAQRSIQLTGSETKSDLYQELSKLGAQLLLETLPDIVNKKVIPKNQDESLASYTKLLKKEDGKIDWNQPAEVIERQVRAYLGWPGSHTELANHGVIITRAHAVPGNSTDANPGDLDVVSDVWALMVETGLGRLCIERLKPAGRREMSAREFIQGYLNHQQLDNVE